MDFKWTKMDQKWTKSGPKWSKMDNKLTRTNKNWSKWTNNLPKMDQMDQKWNRPKGVRADIRATVLNPMMFIKCGANTSWMFLLN